MTKRTIVTAEDAPRPTPDLGAHTHERIMEAMAEEPPAEPPAGDLEQLRAECATLKTDLASLQALYDVLLTERDVLAVQVTQLDARLNPPPEIARPRSCINCGQRIQPIIWDGEMFSCPLCKHTWPPEDELAPFRQGR